MSKTLYLFTDKYPYDEGEQYLENEMQFLAGRFDRIVILPQTRASFQRPVPPNAEVHFLGTNVRYGKLILLKNLPLLLSVLATEWKHGRRELRSFAHLKGTVQQFYNALCHARAFDEYLRTQPQSENYFYSYWFFQWSTMLALLRAQGKIPQFISRAHLGDLYPVFAMRPNYLKAYRLRQISALHPCSEHGSRYLRDTYPHFTHKIKTAYLGVPHTADNPMHSDASFTVVSCSAVDSRKRVGLIASSLALLPFPVRWVHFGHGADLEKLRVQCTTLPPHITAELRGFVPNAQVLEFYRTTPVHVFINLSRYEGLPVSMMEAAAAGIPLIGTHIFGVPEIVDESTGFLLPETPSPEQVAACVEKIYREGVASLREGAQAMHRKRFLDATNYGVGFWGE
ncbi:MAG: glycosyltransferase [Bacteroidia bacterium]|jgi:glycosyltransferase involved in cell wall biosynthesis|nr:glycosyltransferase [Bacteroidia bacterium]